jgi:putative MATE family efflux protein
MEKESTWSLLREAVGGSHRNFTEGSLGQAILLLAVPMVLEMAMESVFAVCDVFFVGRLGAEAVATVGLTESLITLVYTTGMGLGIGAMATVARRIGEQDRDGAAHAAVQALYIGAGASLVLGLIGGIFAPRLLKLMGASAAVLATGSLFARVMLGGSGVIIFLFLINSIFRGAGNAAIAMRVLWLANSLNIVMGPCLIFGLGPFPELGVTGAAIATTSGRGIGALYALSHLLRPGSRVYIRTRHLSPDFAAMGRMLRICASSIVQLFIGMASWVFLTRIISGFGSQAVAGHTIGIRVLLFALLPSMGMGNAAATLVGQSLGARKPDRAEAAVWRAGFYNFVFLGLIGLMFALFPQVIAGWFTSDPVVLGIASASLRTIAFGFPFYAYGMVISQSFNGAGDTRTPTLLNLCCFWMFELPLAWYLAYEWDLGPRGVFWAMMIAFSVFAVAAAMLFRRGRWKAKVI